MSAAKKYLYDRKGPWPQPSPDHPFKEAPAVFNIPKKEKSQFTWNVTIRYALSTLFKWPGALLYALKNRGMRNVTDEDMGNIITGSLFAKMLNPQLDPIDLENFSEVLKGLDKKELLKFDLTPMKFIDETYKGLYAAPSVALMKKVSDTKVMPLAIHLNEQVFTPKDGDAWELAKYYSLNGAAVLGTLLSHPLTHFPYDAINAITKTSLPMDHVIFKLIYPHTYLSLPLSEAVLSSPGTVLAKNNDRIYGPYSAPVGELKDLIAAGYGGMKDNSSYPGYQYPLGPDKAFGEYGNFLKSYYECIYKFVKTVTDTVPKNDLATVRWANYIAAWLPGFPKGVDIFKDDNLAKAVTTFIWDVTVAHSLDHKSFGSLDINKVPMRMRLAPPSKGLKGFDKNKIVKVIDTMKFEMAMIMFYRPSNVRLFTEIKYDFAQAELQKASEEFFKDLKKTDENMKEKYVKLEEIACSIQY